MPVHIFKPKATWRYIHTQEVHDLLQYWCGWPLHVRSVRDCGWPLNFSVCVCVTVIGLYSCRQATIPVHTTLPSRAYCLQHLLPFSLTVHFSNISLKFFVLNLNY